MNASFLGIPSCMVRPAVPSSPTGEVESASVSEIPEEQPWSRELATTAASI